MRPSPHPLHEIVVSDSPVLPSIVEMIFASNSPQQGQGDVALCELFVEVGFMMNML